MRQVILANTGDPQASHLASKLTDTGTKVDTSILPFETTFVFRLNFIVNTVTQRPLSCTRGLSGPHAKASHWLLGPRRATSMFDLPGGKGK